MKIGIVGTGNMGKVIGLTLARQGHSVFFGARDLRKVAGFAADYGVNVQCGSNQAAADYGDVIYYNPRDVAPNEVLTDINALSGKPVICSHNGTVPQDFQFDAITCSKAEILQRQIPSAHVVTAFNTITQETFELAEQGLDALNVCCFVASDTPEAKNRVSQLIGQIGFTPVDCGDLRQSRLIESAADLIRMLMYKAQTPWKAFSLIDLPEVQQVFSGRIQSALHDHKLDHQS
ncbi:NADPH-dependent F420 reductase [Vibrio sp. MEBiC08052]|uniref:NADPH-dependent F420 reductase n=1 Tax=Vibrio sp. MEBiC08052 TaxID=1761910 RepID=UPI00074079AB|nr:NAD(P)-binding domain-containing protein [Vibrio sp. MEBiC08052]KUI99726.1 hypothetical protein VRK_11720 [Vibrio sp. MEBiC08052]